MDAVKEFLIKNGFAKVKSNYYGNYMCDIEITKDHYVIEDVDGNRMYSVNLNIYWLIGYLTYYDFIDKNYVL